MAYEMRVGGQGPRMFESEAEAMAAVRAVVLVDADARVEVIDLATGKPCAPGASAGWREELTGKVGF